MSFIFIIIVCLLLISIVKNFIELSYEYSTNNMKEKRLKQLKRIKTKQNTNMKDVMDFIAENSDKGLMPRLRKLFPTIGKVNLVQLERDLNLVGWDDTFTAETFVSAIWGLKFLSIIFFIIGILINDSIRLIFIGFGCMLLFGFEFYLKSEVSKVKSELIAEFPDFIRIVSGYLSADIPLVKSITSSIKYVGDAWNPILKRFVVDCDNSVDYALERMKNTVDLFEIKEFVGLIRLTLEQGGDAKEGFLSQADKIEELQKDQMIIKVGRRKIMGQVIQLPLLLVNIVVIALPIMAQAMQMFTGNGMTITNITN